MTPQQNDFSQTTLEAALANTKFAVTEQVKLYNEQIKGLYLALFKSWAENVSAGRIDNTNPPKPPAAFVVAMDQVDHTTGPGEVITIPVFWSYPSQTGGPVCEMPPIPEMPGHHTEGEGFIGTELPNNPNWFQCLAGDKTPGGVIVSGTSKDGKSGKFMKLASVFGSNTSTGVVGGWWIKVS